MVRQMGIPEIIEGLSYNERRLLLALEAAGGQSSPADMVAAGKFDLEVEIMGSASWLASKGLAEIKESSEKFYVLADKDIVSSGLPERKAIAAIDAAGGSMDMGALADAMQNGEDKIAVGWLKRKGLADIVKEGDQKILRLTQKGKDTLGADMPDELLLKRMADEGCEYVFMECSSHAIHQHRIGGLRFTGGIFTNLTRDHLDYHGTFENYRDAKKAFFDALPKKAFAITNADDKNGLFMVQNTKATVKTYSTKRMADFRARILECHFEGMYLEIDGREVGVQFIGKFNASNLLAVYAAARMLGKTPEEILVTLSTLKSVSGRLQPVYSPEGYTAIVDYAHTPDALANVLGAIHEVLRSKGRVITVCGAGGNRDKGKRPLMAQEAVKQSDITIITSDNPRFEEPQDIINDMLEGLSAQQRKDVLTIVDRREAIKTACKLANKNDVILVAGKGHENYQEIRGVKHHFDDREELEAIFATQQDNN